MLDKIFRALRSKKQTSKTTRSRRRMLEIESLEGRKLLTATVGVYDENVVAANTVDFVATGSSVNNTQFAANIANAFAQNRGGVINGDYIAAYFDFGVDASKTIYFWTESETNHWGGGVVGSARAISGITALATFGMNGPESFRSTTFVFGAITNGEVNEHVVEMGITALSLTGRDYGTVTTTAYLSGGGSISASRPISELNSQGDTFFGLRAPTGEYITSFKIGHDGSMLVSDLRLFFDDIGFITKVVTPNNSPLAQNDSYAVSEDEVLTVVGPGVLSNDSDPDGDSLTAELEVAPSNGTLDFNADGSFVYTPNANFNGVDSFTYFVFDGGLPSGLATVTINVTPVNDAPTASGGSFSIAENSPSGTSIGSVAASDPDGDTLSFQIVSGNTGGAFSINEATGQIQVANSIALDFETMPLFSLVVSATDGGGLSSQATVIVSLSDVQEIIAVPIDIKPYDSQNSINVRKKGRIEVAILSTSQFSAQSVDVLSLRFGRTGNENSLSLNSRNQPNTQLVDLNGDGLLDLVVRFELDLAGFQLGDTKGILTGFTSDGRAIHGEDRIVTK